jgi:hypothetical protein
MLLLPISENLNKVGRFGSLQRHKFRNKLRENKPTDSKIEMGNTWTA